MQVIFCKLNFVQAVKVVNVTSGTFLKYYLSSLLMNSSLLPGRFGSLSRPAMVFSFIRSPHIISHQLEISTATSITAFPLRPIQSYSITSHYWIQEAECHISIHAKMSPVSPVGRLSLQNKTCCCWHRHYPVQTRLSVILIFLTLHIYFVPFHCSNGQSFSFQLTTSLKFLQNDSLKGLFNFPISRVSELFILWIKYQYCLTDVLIRLHTLNKDYLKLRSVSVQSVSLPTEYKLN